MAPQLRGCVLLSGWLPTYPQRNHPVSVLKLGRHPSLYPLPGEVPVCKVWQTGRTTLQLLVLMLVSQPLVYVLGSLELEEPLSVRHHPIDR